MAAETISNDYLKLQTQLHQNPNYGVASLAFAPIVADLIRQLNIRTLADYRAGKKNLLVRLTKARIELQAYYPYDPVFPEYRSP